MNEKPPGIKLTSLVYLRLFKKITNDKKGNEKNWNFSIIEKKFSKKKLPFSKIWNLKKRKLIYKKKLLCEFLKKIYFLLALFWTFYKKKTENENKISNLKLKLLKNSSNITLFYSQLEHNLINITKKVFFAYPNNFLLKNKSKLNKNQPPGNRLQNNTKMGKKKNYPKVVLWNSETRKLITKNLPSFALFQLRIFFELKNNFKRTWGIKKKLIHLKKKIYEVKKLSFS